VNYIFNLSDKLMHSIVAASATCDAGEKSHNISARNLILSSPLLLETRVFSCRRIEEIMVYHAWQIGLGSLPSDGHMAKGASVQKSVSQSSALARNMRVQENSHK
jgi:hypothetical protein